MTAEELSVINALDVGDVIGSSVTKAENDAVSKDVEVADDETDGVLVIETNEVDVTNDNFVAVDVKVLSTPEEVTV